MTLNIPKDAKAVVALLRVADAKFTPLPTTKFRKCENCNARCLIAKSTVDQITPDMVVQYLCNQCAISILTQAVEDGEDVTLARLKDSEAEVRATREYNEKLNRGQVQN